MEDEMVLDLDFEEDEIAQNVERKMRVEAIVRLVINILLLINWVLTLTGKNPIPFSEEVLYTWLSGIISSAGLLWGCWWKNNNITEQACKAQTYKDELMQNKKYYEEPDMGDWDDEEEPVEDEEVNE